MLLDLHPSDQEMWARPKPNEGARLPATTEEGIAAAWNESRLFSASTASGAAQVQALEDYIADVKQRTGADLTKQANQIHVGGDFSAVNDEVAKLNAGNPDLKLPNLSIEELDRRAALLSRAARKTYEEQAAGEGGGFGRFLGGLAGAATDPFNLVAGVVTGGEGGIVLHALRFGAAAGAAQAANEAANESFRERVQPGYGASGEPGTNILGAGVGGAGLAVGGKVVGAVIGRLWGRAKTGTWPTSVRDAGNALESEAHTQGTNVYPGVAGEAAHRDALAGAVDQIVKGEPVDVAAHITPEVEASRLPIEEQPRAATAAEAARAAREAEPSPAPELPFEATAAEAQAETAMDALRSRVAQIAESGGHTLAPEEVAAIADRLAKAGPEDAADALRAVKTAPHQLAAEPPPKRAIPQNMVVGFHGSGDVISRIDPEKTRLQRGAFFSSEPELASKFAEGRAVDSDSLMMIGEDEPADIKKWVTETVGEAEGKRIGAMVDHADELGKKMEGMDFESPEYLEAQRKYTEAVHAAMPELSRVTAISEGAPNITRSHVNLGKTYEYDLGGKFSWEREREAIDYAREHGYDSVTFVNTGEKGKFYSVFRSEQVEPFFAEPLMARSPEDVAKALASPDHEAAVRADLERAMANAATGQGAREITTSDLKKKFAGPEGSYEFDNKAADAYVRSEVQAALDAGQRVTLTVEGKARRITEVTPLGLKDENGNPWGVLGTMIMTRPGEESRIRISKPADIKIPAGVDERGEPIYRSATAALDEVDQLKAAADHIQACVNPSAKEAAE